MNDPEMPEDHPLNTLLEAERIIAKQLADERSRADRWLEAQTAEVARRVALEAEAIAAHRREHLAAKKEEAELRAETMVAEASALSRRIASIDLNSLHELILRHLAPLDPRTRDDRPHVKD